MSGSIQGSQPASALVPLPRVARQIEADISLQAHDSKMHVDGDVFIGHRFLPAVVRNALQSTKDLRNVSLTFNPDDKRYTIQGEAKFAGIFWKAGGSTRADVDGHDVILRDVNVNFPGSSINWLSNKVRDGIVSGLNGQGIAASREGHDIRISGTGLLKEAGVIPAWASLTDDTVAKASHDHEGNLTLHFGPGDAGVPDGTSHIRAKLDTAASTRVLTDLFGSQYDLKKAEFQNGSIQVHGSTSVPEIRDAVNGVATVIGLMSGDLATILGGNPPMQTTPKIGLDMAMRAEGNDIVIRPSLRAAVDPIAGELRKGGAPVQATKDEVRVNAGAMLPEGKVQKLAVTEGGLELEADVNVDAILSPAIR